ncbi:putative nucleoside-diphosphate-sugar epimerase [Thiomonas sp. X19]|uniref:NAD-dependent epimerase/dehydratase family protein n=1 Tax=Thiomonas sp. X19 TaxID=1050370 RepID=UPI000B70406C|nr:NAD-dependent epimerase/dehydratase family protein [Thiomonas sp. X19]SCC92684.1 putative nucleoside-diphosphate-sugar epimerase [Thiomonas sp. X19]
MLMRQFRKPGLLIVGCGDIGLRLAALAQPRFRVIALTSSPERMQTLRQAGIVPLLGNLDDADSLWRLAGLAHWVAMLAPPPAAGVDDARSARLVAVLRRGMIGAGPGRPLRVVYASTSGVYGDCAGAEVTETRPPHPQTGRARRRIAAEAHWRRLGRARHVRLGILRIPGIYDSRHRSPARRLRQGLPALRAEDDVYTSHIHADDLARITLLALFRSAPNRVYHASDSSRIKMGDYLDLAARLYGLPAPARVAREQAQASGLSPMALSFMAESRLLDNTRLLGELGVVLRYPDVELGLQSGH